METALVKVQSDVMLATDVGLVVVQVLLDLSAAFDTIDHSILLHRLKYRFGVSGPALEWFASYLSGRYTNTFALESSRQASGKCQVGFLMDQC